MTNGELQNMGIEIAVDFMKNMQWSHVWPNVGDPDGDDVTNAFPQTDRVLTEDEKVKYINDASRMAAVIYACFFTNIVNISKE